MYIEKPDQCFTSTLVKIKYDCCGKEHSLKFKDASKNFEKNNQKHVCRPCWLKSDANPAKKEETKVKTKKTNLERYGATSAMNTPKSIEKRKQQFKDENFKSQWLEKHRLTSQERYGVDHPMHTDAVKEKQRQTMQEKYGVDHPYQSPEILAKMKASNLEKYGVENVASLPEVRTKMALTSLERHGVEHYNQLPEMKDYLREHCKEWLADSYANPWAKGITRPEEWNRKQSETVCNLIDKGEWNGGGRTYQGKYQSTKCKKRNPMFRSGYELAVHFFLDSSNEVLFYDYEPFQVPYYDSEGKKRHYTIDFIVVYTNGSIKAIEVKNNYSEIEYLNGPKYQAIKSELNQQGIIIEVWSNKKIKSIGLENKVMFSNPRVLLF